MQAVPIFLKYVVEYTNITNSYNRILQKVTAASIYSSKEKGLFEEALFVKHFTEWERMIYDIFTYCVSLDTARLEHHVGLPLPKSLTIDNAHAILHGLHFTSFSSSKELLSLADKFIVVANNPFQQFLSSILKYVDQAFLIRNYIVHKSLVAKKKVENIFMEEYGIDKFIEPGIFFQQERSFELGKTKTSHQFYIMLSQVALHTWRHLNRESYDMIFATDEAKKNAVIAYYKMALFFEDLTIEFKWET